MSIFWPLATGLLLAIAAMLFFSRERYRRRVERLREELAVAREKTALYEARKEALDERIAEQRNEFQRMQDQLKLEFRNTANTLLEENSKKFSTHSETQIGNLLNPLRERLGEFQKKIDDSFGKQSNEQFSLKKEIERIVLQADGLTKALRGDVKVQGNWGEIALERILEQAGLKEGIHYTLQGGSMGLHSADGTRQRPDVIVKLPDDKHVVIDAKVSLISYDRYCAEADESARAGHVKDFIRSTRTHIAGLAGKGYQDSDKLSTPEFVCMFLPLEGAYFLAAGEDRELHDYAWQRRVVLVSSMTLLATLQTIASLWKIESQNRNAQEIAAAGGRLYDKFVGFLADLQDIGKNIGRLQTSYEDALKKIRDGSGNLIGHAEKLKRLGAKTSKSIPKELLSEEEEDAAPALALIADNA